MPPALDGFKPFKIFNIFFQEMFQKIQNFKSDSHLPKKILLICFNGSPLKNDEKCFLFHLKSSFHSQDI